MHRLRTARLKLGQTVCHLVILVAMLVMVAGSSVAGAQGGTPATTEGPVSMAELFGLVPAELPELEDQAGAMISWVDVAAQLEAVGVEAPESMDAEGFDAWSAATRTLALPSDAAMFLNAWREDYGFDLLQVDQAVTVQLPPFNLAIYRGRFDTEEVQAALDELGYREVEVGGHTLLSIRGDFEIDIAAPTAYRLAGMNFGVVLDDGTIAFSSAGAPLAAVLDVAAGATPSMMELAGVATVVEAAPADMVSAVLIQGFQLAQSIPPSMLDALGEGTPDISAISTAAAAEISEASELPPVVMALLGSTAGGPLDGEGVEVPPGTPEARAVAVLLMLGDEAAEASVPVIEDRLVTGESGETGQPYASMFADWSVERADGAPVVLVELVPGEGTFPNILTRMLFSRDLGFLAW